MTDNQKAIFYAQYINQDVWVPLSTDDRKTAGILFSPNFCASEVGFLLLRSVNQLTDEEAHKVCLLAYTPFYDHKMGPDTIRLGKGVLDLPYFNERTATYLKLIGVLVRFTYLNEAGQPITLQPEEIIQRGWAKIKEQNTK